MSDTNEPQCGSCEFTRPAAAGRMHSLECHKSPPVIVADDSGPLTCWPTVTPEDWCAEYKGLKTRDKPRVGGGAQLIEPDPDPQD